MSTGLIKVQDLYTDLATTKKDDALVVLLNQPPKAEWVKKHPFISNYRYLPIDKVEFLLKKIFKQNYKIEVIKTGMLLNAVEVTVRVHFKDIVSGEWFFHDGVGAQELQTQKGTGSLKLDMTNINNGALSMALPIAKTMAIKDACDHLGTLFGSDLNRKDTLQITPDEILSKDDKLSELKKLYNEYSFFLTPEENKDITAVITDQRYRMYQKGIDLLNRKKPSDDNQSE